jgi:hypothetical protein
VKGLFPLWIKLIATSFVTILIPVYAVHYGWANFLWFSDIALFTSVLALWLDSRLLASMTALSALAVESAWIVDFFWQLLTGRQLLGFTGYMFDARHPLWIRALSLFHLAMPILFVWMMSRLGYDPRALLWQTIFAWTILLVTYFFTDPADNINWAFGPGSQPQSRLPPLVYLVLLMLFLPLAVYLPTHLGLQHFFGSKALDG